MKTLLQDSLTIAADQLSNVSGDLASAKRHVEAVHNALVAAEDALAVQASYRMPDQTRIEAALQKVRAVLNGR